MKIAYIGIDLLSQVLECLMHLDECEIMEVFTCDTDNITEFNTRVIEAAKFLQIPWTKKRITRDDIHRLKANGCDLIICAGYYYKVPVAEEIAMVNVHPSYLPNGRGAWPMPVAILRGDDYGGVSIHKMTEQLDEGDILLQERFEIMPDENLTDYMRHVNDCLQRMTARLIKEFSSLYEKAVKQGDGSYDPCPQEKDWTITADMEDEKIDRILRAFYGYECVWEENDRRYELIGGRMIQDRSEMHEHEQCFVERASGNLVVAGKVTELHTAAAEDMSATTAITLQDRERFHACLTGVDEKCSAYAFPSLFVWRGEFQLTVHWMQHSFAIRKGSDGPNTWFFPCGDEDECKAFIEQKLQEEHFKLVYILEQQKALLEKWFPYLAVNHEDCADKVVDEQAADHVGSSYILTEDPTADEYICSISQHMKLEGKAFRNVRNHWLKANREHTLRMEDVTQENEHLAFQILAAWQQSQEIRSGEVYPDDQNMETSEKLLLENRAELGGEISILFMDEEAFGVIGGYPLSGDVFNLSLAKEKYHVPGIAYASKHMMFEKLQGRYPLVNLEEDLGSEGMRRMKEALVPVQKVYMWKLCKDNRMTK